MKKAILTTVLLFSFFLFLNAQEEAAYFNLGYSKQSMQESMSTVKTTLEKAGFRILGEYHPANTEKLGVVCYTSPELEQTALQFPDRGALGATLKIGFKQDENGVKISMINPMYLFYAYFVDGIEAQEQNLRDISNRAIQTIKTVGSEFTPFGGKLDKKKLQRYHYKMMMPYFTDAEVLKEFSSFEEGLQMIDNNLNAHKGNTATVYKLVYRDRQIAVWGIALKDPKKGEARFLPIISDEHVAALPYELILQGKTASILPGRYRIALHWPELSMGTFMKIVSTPGDIKDTMEDLTK